MEPNAANNLSQAHFNEIQAVQNAISLHKIEDLQKEVGELKTRVEALSDERNSALKWGVIVLGSTVIGLITFIVGFFSDQVK